MLSFNPLIQYSALATKRDRHENAKCAVDESTLTIALSKLHDEI